MFTCKNCGGNIRYNIKEKKLICNMCGSAFEPEEVKKDDDSVDYDFFETCVFTCPQCGARIMCDDDDATGFCSYCASSVILTSRICRKKKADYIIPFEKTKEECIANINKITKRAFFAPKELRDTNVLDKIRAIYVPYWFYEADQEAIFKVSANEVYGDANMRFTTIYDVTGKIKGEYEGICRDGSSKFSDDLQQKIAPFYISEKKKFYPSYLSGFYADIPDIPAKVYKSEVERIANDTAVKILEGEAVKGDYKDVKLYISNNEASKQFNTFVSAKRALFPVWFVSFKNKNKVAYVTVNGQTGAAYTDFPISIRKYLSATFIMMFLICVPIAFFLFFFRSIFLKLFVDISIIASLITFIIYYIEVKRMQILDYSSEDAGLFYKKYEVIYTKNKDRITFRDYIKSNLSDILVVILYIFLFIFYMAFAANRIKLDRPEIILRTLICTASLITAGVGFFKVTSIKRTSNYYGIIVGMIAVAVALIFQISFPSALITSLLSGMFLCIGCFLTIFDLIKYHNELSTRKPPHFDKRGGEEIADDLDL